ncbi:MAG TPA: hypothetical protein VE046_19185 [Steroidobacteraceae bacterium]|nr:hypothetical protein [Steroidobacteraceae bacterium]
MADKDGTKPKRKIDARWHAIHIAAGTNACPAALEIGKRRFLSKEAPKLPLPECTMPASCRCAYKHHTDRRAAPRRWSDQGGAARVRPQGERRGPRGRREDD